MLTYGDGGQLHKLIPAIFCSRMLKYADVWRMLTYADVQLHKLIPAIFWDNGMRFVYTTRSKVLSACSYLRRC
jgi:hypothetical protein